MNSVARSYQKYLYFALGVSLLFFPLTLTCVSSEASALAATDVVSQPSIEDWQTRVFKELESLYAPLMQATARKLTFEIRPLGGLPFATAESDGKSFKVIVEAELLRQAKLSPDGLRFILCHELGHIFGGAPRRNPPMDWDGPVTPDQRMYSSSEGQADFYANLICFRRLVKGQDHKANLDRALLTPRLVQLCEQSWGVASPDALICERAALGGFNSLRLSKEFAISFQTPDPAVVTALLRDQYPDRQCRLDTMLAGAVCKNSFGLELDFDHSAKNECGEAVGRRPRCWYF